VFAVPPGSPPYRDQPASAPYRQQNLFDRLSSRQALQTHYAHAEKRERELLDRRLGLTGGTVLSVGSGWHPGRHLFPAPEFHLTAVDADPERVASVLETGRADAAEVGYAGALHFAEGSFDVVLYRLVLHHLAYQGPLSRCFSEAARLLRPRGVLVAIEPGSWHPVGAGLSLANQIGIGPLLHGTPDDIPLSPRRLVREAWAAGLQPEIHAVTYTWRRLPERMQRRMQALDRLGSRPRLARLGHTLMLIARAG
jgi:SAM-dependent methyltransferase